MSFVKGQESGQADSRQNSKITPNHYLVSIYNVGYFAERAQTLCNTPPINYELCIRFYELFK